MRSQFEAIQITTAGLDGHRHDYGRYVRHGQPSEPGGLRGTGSRARPGNPRPAESGPRFPVPGRSGNGPFPDSRFPATRESGIGKSPQAGKTGPILECPGRLLASKFGSLRRHRPKSPSHTSRPPSPRPSRHPPSAGPWQLKKELEGGGRPESAFEGLKATSSPGSCQMYSHRRVSPISRVAANRGPDSRFPAELLRIGKRGISRFPFPAESGIGTSLPVFRPNRESGERE